MVATTAELANPLSANRLRRRLNSFVRHDKGDFTPLALSKTLVIGITATALFDLTEADGVFKAKFEQDKETAVAEYRAYMLKHEDEPLADGTGKPLVKALLQLNRYQKTGEPPLVEVVVMSRNSPETGVRVSHNIRAKESRSAGGARSSEAEVVDNPPLARSHTTTLPSVSTRTITTSRSAATATALGIVWR